MVDISKRYEEKIGTLFRMVPSFQKVGKAGYHPGIGTMRMFDDSLGNPHRKFKTIHVAGTNGKGSVSSMLASVLMGMGYRVGLYTSPHLADFRERIKVNGEMITHEAVLDFLDRSEGFVAENDPSFFEITTAMAFDYFAACGVDYAVVECGLGGRLDSTNIVTPVLSVITSIGLDHTDILGDTEEKIAFEKGGIIKAGVPVVAGQVTDSVAEVLGGIAEERGAMLYMMGAEIENNPSHLTMGPSLCGQRGSTVFSSQPPSDDSQPTSHSDHIGHENAAFCSQTSLLGHIGHENAAFCAQTSLQTHIGHENANFCAQPPLLDHIGHENAAFCAQTSLQTHIGHENAAFCAHFPDSVLEDILSKMDLKGDYQRSNLKTVLKCLEVLSMCGLTAEPDQVADSICHAAERTGFRGRWEVLSQKPYVVCDIAHNPHGIRPVMEQLKRVFQEALSVMGDNLSGNGASPRLFLVFGVMGDKDLESISDYLPREAYYFYTAADSPRAMNPNKLFQWMSDHGFKGEVTRDVVSAVHDCLVQASENDIIYIGGSSYVVAEAIKLF